MEDHEEKQLKADIMRKTMHSMELANHCMKKAEEAEHDLLAALQALRAWKAREFSILLSLEKDRAMEKLEQLTELLGATMNGIEDAVQYLLDQIAVRERYRLEAKGTYNETEKIDKINQQLSLLQDVLDFIQDKEQK